MSQARKFGGWPSPLSDEATLRRAQAELLRGDTVADVAESVGYRSVSAFSRAFREHMALAPRQWVLQTGGAA